jgi:oligopeptidase A
VVPLKERVVGDTRAPTWETVAEPIADTLDRLHRAWGALRHMNAVVSTPALRDAYNGNLPRITTFYTELGQDERLYAKYRALAASSGFASLDDARRRVIENELRDFRLTGAELPPAQKTRFKAISEELASLTATFDDHVLDATNDYALFVDDERRLAGLPDDVVAEAREAARSDGRDGWKLTVRMPCFLPVMKYADDRTLRAELHRAQATRASDLGARAEWDNGPLIERVLALRLEAANLLGYPDYATLSLVPKMAGGTDEVLAFLRDLAKRAKPYAERDLAELTAFARDRLGIDRLEPWDIAYASEKLMKRLGLKIGDFEVIELNEAFAAQGLAVLRQLGLPDDAEHVNPNGGAIALGHPLGMSGARLALTATEELQRSGGKLALATMCIGVGQGIALALERV